MCTEKLEERLKGVDHGPAAYGRFGGVSGRLFIKLPMAAIRAMDRLRTTQRNRPVFGTASTGKSMLRSKPMARAAGRSPDPIFGPGTAKHANDDHSFLRGDTAFMRGPPHEPQGWYVVFDSYASTQAVIQDHARMLARASVTPGGSAG